MPAPTNSSAFTAVLVHSPFLGPASLRPLADALAAHGHPTDDPHAAWNASVVLPDLRPSVVSVPVHQVLVGAFADAIGEEQLTGPVVLIGHSGAGPLLPAFADALEDTVTGLVFLDAGLPTPGRSWRDTVPAELYARLKSVSREGQLPRWPDWFSPNPLRRIANDLLRADIAEEAPEVPVAFLKEPRPDVAWSGPAGYVALSEGYADDATAAAERGWPVRRLDSHHLAPATDPDPVAVAVLAVLGELLRAG